MSWTVVANSWQYTSIYGADGKRLFLMDLEDWDVSEDNQEPLEKQQADIARLASNAPAMLAALYQIAAEDDTGPMRYAPQDRGPSQALGGSEGRFAKIAREAIAKATS